MPGQELQCSLVAIPSVLNRTERWDESRRLRPGQGQDGELPYYERSVQTPPLLEIQNSRMKFEKLQNHKKHKGFGFWLIPWAFYEHRLPLIIHVTISEGGERFWCHTIPFES